MDQREIIISIRKSHAKNLFYAIAKAIIHTAKVNYSGTKIPANSSILIPISFNSFEQHLLSNGDTLKKILEAIGDFSIVCPIRYRISAAIISIQGDLFLSDFRKTPLYRYWELENLPPPPPHLYPYK